MLLGYARVSKSDDQDPAAQVRALEAAGCRKVLKEAASGGRWDRPELHRLLDQLREGDVVVVWKLDRLSRSLKDLLLILERIEQAEAGFRSLTEAVDTTGPAGRMMMQMLGAFAEFRARHDPGAHARRPAGRPDPGAAGRPAPEAHPRPARRDRRHGHVGRKARARLRPAFGRPPRHCQPPDLPGAPLSVRF